MLFTPTGKVIHTNEQTIGRASWEKPLLFLVHFPLILGACCTVLLLRVDRWTPEQHAVCISGTDLRRQLYVLLHWNRDCRSTLRSQLQYAGTGSAIPSADLVTAGVWQGIHQSTFLLLLRSQLVSLGFTIFGEIVAYVTVCFVLVWFGLVWFGLVWFF